MIQHVLIGADAAQTHRTDDTVDQQVIGRPIDLGKSTTVSLEIEWQDLVGVINCTLTMYVSNRGVKWIPKSRIVYTITTANGIDLVAITETIAEQYAQLVFDPHGVTGGTVECWIYGK